jgi:hypothetical protein
MLGGEARLDNVRAGAAYGTAHDQVVSKLW